jgi:CubicO group peptidase (beta-lactamase class C family)
MVFSSAWKPARPLRRMALAVVMAALAASGVQAQDALRKLRADGPNAQTLGQAQGYPTCINALQQASCRVGTWSGGTTSQVRQPVLPSATPWPMPDHASPPPIRWRWGLLNQTVDDYMDATQTTGLLILKNGQVVAERYQYDRQPGMPMRSFSMAKTFTAMLVGIAHDKGLIRSLDDRAADYWPEIGASAYGQTTIRNLLRMASGVPFKELYTWTPDDDNWVWGMVLYHPRNANQPGKIAEFLNARTTREVEQGQRFHYASIETEILGRVLRRATGQSVAKLTQDWLWQPMGAENAAHWLISSTDGAEGVAGSFNASLRDYGRFGMLLANDGVRDGQAIIPREFLLDATDPQRQPAAFRPKVATPFMGYGYQTWLLPYRTRTFALQGIHGQTVYVQPASQIIMVQTAVHTAPSGRQDMRPYQFRHALWEGVLRSLGGSVD